MQQFEAAPCWRTRRIILAPQERSRIKSPKQAGMERKSHNAPSGDPVLLCPVTGQPGAVTMEQHARVKKHVQKTCRKKKKTISSVGEIALKIKKAHTFTSQPNSSPIPSRRINFKNFPRCVVVAAFLSIESNHTVQTLKPSWPTTNSHHLGSSPTQLQIICYRGERFSAAGLMGQNTWGWRAGWEKFNEI